MHETLPQLTVLGAGYVGGALLRRFPAAAATRRRPQEGLHVFDLEDEASWRNPPLAGRHVVWTFPAEPVDRVRAFHRACLGEAASLIVLGSTSAYLLSPEDEADARLIDEHAPLDLGAPRVQGEEWLRGQGATVLQLAGIFGPGREPEGWLRRGRIRDGAKLVNLIHVDDILAAIARLLEQPLPGERINAANGEPLAWRELAERFRRSGRLPADWTLPESGPGTYGKRVDNRRLHALLPGRDFLRP